MLFSSCRHGDSSQCRPLVAVDIFVNSLISHIYHSLYGGYRKLRQSSFNRRMDRSRYEEFSFRVWTAGDAIEAGVVLNGDVA
jgi:hypothetical protein